MTYTHQRTHERTRTHAERVMICVKNKEKNLKTIMVRDGMRRDSYPRQRHYDTGNPLLRDGEGERE